MSHFSSWTARTTSTPEGLFLLLLLILILIRMLYFGIAEVSATVERKANGESLSGGGPDDASH